MHKKTSEESWCWESSRMCKRKTSDPGVHWFERWIQKGSKPWRHGSNNGQILGCTVHLVTMTKYWASLGRKDFGKGSQLLHQLIPSEAFTMGGLVSQVIPLLFMFFPHPPSYDLGHNVWIFWLLRPFLPETVSGFPGGLTWKFPKRKFL